MSQTTTPVRPPVRQEVRLGTPRELAARRTAEFMGQFGGKLPADQDEYYISPDSIPDAWDYAWRTYTVFNREDPTYQVKLANTGWTAVPASRHPEFLPKGSTVATIVRSGLMLMERPMQITELYRARDHREAIDQVRVKEAELADTKPGQLDRMAPKLSKSMEQFAVPD
jgi:hypothetical protein